jgi:Flp pilus assembly protein TadG
MRKLFVRDKKGQSLIEFALVLPILLLVLFAIVEFGLAIMTANILHTASREGARLAAVKSVADSILVQNRVQEILVAANITDASITVLYDLDDHTVSVTVSKDFVIFNGGPLDPVVGPIPLSAYTVMRYEG